MSRAACKIIINQEVAAAMGAVENQLDAFHQQVDMLAFKQLSSDEQDKAYQDQMKAEEKLTKFLLDWNSDASKRGLELGVKIDAEVK